MNISSLLLISAVLLLSAATMADMEIRQVVPVSPTQRQAIQKAAQNAAQEAEAARAVAALRRDADALLEVKPRPLSEIFYQGLLDTNPRRVETEKSLIDLERLAALSEAFAATGDERYAAKAREFVLAWASTYKPNGNSINENKLEPGFLAYDLLREKFSTEQKSQIEGWMRQIARQQIDTNGWRDREHSKKALDNWDSKRIKIVGVIGWVLGEEEWQNYALQGFKDYVRLGLFPDGTSVDLKTRDALSYHVSGLRPLLVMAMWAEIKTPGEGRKLFDYQAPNGASLRKSVEFVLPYARGEKIHEEWKNTTVELDRQRAAAGLAYYQPGKPFNPLASLELFEMASAFDSKFLPVVATLHARAAEKAAKVDEAVKESDSGHTPPGTSGWLTLVSRTFRPKADAAAVTE
jgi:hypothetical protein